MKSLLGSRILMVLAILGVSIPALAFSVSSATQDVLEVEETHPSSAPPLKLELIWSNFDLSTGVTTQRRSPSVAYNSVDNEYMVVWFDTRNPGNNDVFGQRASAKGALLGENVPIIEFAEAQFNPLVVHNSTDNKYLVAWQTQQPGFFNDVYGRRVSSTGMLLGGDFFILSEYGYGDEFSMVYNPAENEYLVTARSRGIRGRRVSNSGDLLGAEFIISTALCCPAPNGQVSYNSNANEYLVTWRDQLETERNLKGRRISASGALIGDEIVISPIFTGSGRHAASVAFDPTNDRFLVVFGLFYEKEIWGQFVSSSGEMIGTNFPIATGLASYPVPHVAYSSAHSAFVVVWRDGSDIIGQLLSDEGNLIGDTLVVARRSASGDPTLAYNIQTAEFLVVWPDNRNISVGEEDVFGQLIRITSEVLVPIDIKPGSDPNSINCNNEKGVIPVAILTTEAFDATSVDHTTVIFEGAGETHVAKKTGEPRRHEEDVDYDGDMDLVFHFRLGDTDLTCDSTEGTLTGETFDGQAIEGSDSVRMINRGGGPPFISPVAP